MMFQHSNQIRTTRRWEHDLSRPRKEKKNDQKQDQKQEHDPGTQEQVHNAEAWMVGYLKLMIQN